MIISKSCGRSIIKNLPTKKGQCFLRLNVQCYNVLKLFPQVGVILVFSYCNYVYIKRQTPEFKVMFVNSMFNSPRRSQP